MKILDKKKRTILILVLICSVQLIVSLLYAEQKSFLYPDELFSYVSANRVDGVSTDFPANEWVDENWYLDYLTVQSEHRFEYSIPWNNQATDVHPPLYYLFVHTTCSLIPEQFSFVAGIGFNIFFFLGSTIGLYFVGKELFKDSNFGLLLAFIFAFSYAGLNTMVFIRMYMLMTFILIWHVYVYLKYFEQDVESMKGYAGLAITLILGVLTQYYFLIIAFFFGVWYTVKFIVEKKYIKLKKYLITVVGSGIGCLAIYPTMIDHLLGTGRGKQARENFVSSEGYFSNLRTMWKILDSQLFTNLFVIVLLGLCAFLILYLKKGYKISKDGCICASAILFSCVGYFLVVTRVAPYRIDRYLMPIYPLIYLLVVGGIYVLIKRCISERISIFLCAMGFFGLSAIHLIHSGVPYTYAIHEEVNRGMGIAEEYEDCYAIYVGEKQDIPEYFEIIQVLKEYKGFYNINNFDCVEEVQNDMKKLLTEKNIVIYLNRETDGEEAFAFIKEIMPGVEIGENNLIYSDEEWKEDVYLLSP